MFKLRLNQSGMYNLDGVTLKPGVNTVSKEQYETLKQHDGFNFDVSNHLIDVIEKNITPESDKVESQSKNEQLNYDDGAILKKQSRGRPKKETEPKLQS